MYYEDPKPARKIPWLQIGLAVVGIAFCAWFGGMAYLSQGFTHKSVLGTWEIIEVDGETVDVPNRRIKFTPTVMYGLRKDPAGGWRVTAPVEYFVDHSQDPMWLDIQNQDKPVSKCLVDVEEDRLRFLKTPAGSSRPVDFDHPSRGSQLMILRQVGS